MLFFLKNRNLSLNFLIRIFFFFSLSMLLPTLPLYIVELGGDISQVGLVMGAFAVGVFVFRPVVGSKVDTLGRKIVLLFGIIIFIVSPLLYGFIKSVTSFIPIRVFHGLGLAAFSTASITLAIDSAPQNRRGEMIGYMTISNALAFAAGPVIGSALLSKWGHDVLFMAVSAMAVISCMLSLFLSETRSKETSKTKVTYQQAVVRRGVLIPSLLLFLITTIHGGVAIFIPVLIAQKLPVINIGLFFAALSLASLIIRLVSGRISDKVGRGPVALAALVCIGVGVFLFAGIETIKMMIISGIIYGIGFGGFQPTLSAMVADNTSADTRGKVFSFYFAAFDLGISIAGIVLGVFADRFGIGNMFYLASTISFLAMIVFLTLMEKGVIESVKCALSIQRAGSSCYICGSYEEVPPEQLTEYFEQLEQRSEEQVVEQV